METRRTIEAILREHRPRLAAEYGVSKLGLFGSVAKDSVRAESDIDIVVEFEKPLGLRFVEFSEELERLLGRKVHVLTPAGLSGIRLRQVGKEIAESVLYV
ncbi:MAG: nucleotidyltransferase family protein [Pyrinomonadaceae bacterium]